jgi:DNA-binding PadR family transcriptional regulator
MQNRTKRPTAAQVERHLPPRPVAAAVLAALADGPRIGVDILEKVNATVPGSPLLGPGTLYRLLRELRQQGLISHADTAQATDDRHSPHELTMLGRAVLEAELARLQHTISLAGGIRPAKSHG